ncbi:MAG: PAS domain S-box protein [Spirochaetes bacterium]|nr:PAS domain S-box protein [Spirochaetota bacterium]
MTEKRDRNVTIPFGMLWDIVNEARDFISVASGDGRVLFLNEAGRKMVGIDVEADISGIPIRQVYPDRIWELLQNEALPAARKHGSWIGETVILRKGGTEIPVSQIIRAHTKEGGITEYYSTIIRDISKRKTIERALQSSEKKFFSAFHSSPTMKLMIRLGDERIIDINESYLSTIGFSRDDVVDRTIGESTAWGSADERAAFLEMIRAGSLIDNFEFSFSTPGAQRRTALFSAETVEVDDENVLLLEAIDITDRKNAEDAFKRSENKFIKVYQSSPEAITISRLSDGTYIEVNESALELSRYKREEVIGRTPVDLQVFARYRDYLRILTMLRRNRLVKKLEFDFRTKYGDIRNGIVSAEIIDFGGEPCVITSVVDITDRKRAERALDRQRERLAVTLRSIGDGVITTNMYGEVALVNKVAEELTGWTQEEAYGKPLQEVFSIVNERTRVSCENPVEMVLESGGTVELANHTALIARDGTERIIADSGAPIRDKEGTIIGVVLVFRDITDKQRMEAEIQKMQQIESLGVLAGGIAHDFNNILTSILGNINLGRLYTRPGEKLHEILVDAEKSVLRARDLTRQLLTLSKGGKPLKRSGSIENLLRDTAIFALRGSNIIPEFDFEEALWQSEFDEAQMGQVFNNLVLNARQAMHKGGVIKISASNMEGGSVMVPPVGDGRFVRITVADSGEGIPEGHLPHIYDPYFTTKKNGTGLGLTTTFSIIRNHDGYIHAESTPGVGTVFSVYMPAVSVNPQNKARQDAGFITGRGKILFMDDEELVRTIASKLLRHLGYDVTCVPNGEDAITEFARALEDGGEFDAVILDLTVPGGMGGTETIGKIRDLAPGVRAIVSSGYSNDPVMAEYKNYGFDEVAVKPYKIEELSEVLYRVLKG